MSFRDNLIRIMDEKKISQRQLAMRSGVDRSQINKLINDKGDTEGGSSIRTLKKLAEALEVSPEELIESATSDKKVLPPKSLTVMFDEFKNKLEKLEVVEIPIRGIIPAGNPAVEEETELGTVFVTRDMIGGKIGRVYALKIGGESLNGDGIHYGDNVLVDPDAPLIDGKIYAVRLGNEVVARHVFKENGHIRLESSNGEFKRIEATGVEIMGRIVASVKQLRH